MCSDTFGNKSLFIGVDVGTCSARAAVVDASGKVLRQTEKIIKTWNPKKDHFEQSTEDIWSSICYCVKELSVGISKNQIKAISFDASCSLVILDKNLMPISVSSTGRNEQNVILWMDHRAEEETDFINSTGDDILRFVGGKVSVEMQLPKLLWLKKYLLRTYDNIGFAFDLVDYLTWRSTGIPIRSKCTAICKWNYDAENSSWKRDFLKKIGLDDLCDNEFSKIGNCFSNPGDRVGRGLCDAAAQDFGLSPDTIVGLGLIDAHAGALAMFGCQYDTKTHLEMQDKMVIISGTSTCHMSITREPTDATGIWGPYKNVIFPDFYLNEGGQSATGILLDTFLNSHPTYTKLLEQFGDIKKIYSYLNNLIYKMADEKHLRDIGLLTENLHIWPDFHGNRSPIADANLKGMICGMTLTNDTESLALTYLALIQALAYGTLHIIQKLEENRSTKLKILLFCGGLSKNNVYVKCHADICNLPVLIPNEQEKVLVGAAMLAAYAAKEYASLEETARHMGGLGTLICPIEEVQNYHHKKYKVFLKMLEDQKYYEEIMKQSSS